MEPGGGTGLYPSIFYKPEAEGIQVLVQPGQLGKTLSQNKKGWRCMAQCKGYGFSPWVLPSQQQKEKNQNYPGNDYLYST